MFSNLKKSIKDSVKYSMVVSFDIVEDEPLMFFHKDYHILIYLGGLKMTIGDMDQ